MNSFTTPRIYPISIHIIFFVSTFKFDLQHMNILNVGRNADFKAIHGDSLITDNTDI